MWHAFIPQWLHKTTRFFQIIPIQHDPIEIVSLFPFSNHWLGVQSMVYHQFLSLRLNNVNDFLCFYFVCHLSLLAPCSLNLNSKLPTFSQHNKDTSYSKPQNKESKNQWPQNVNLPIQERIWVIIRDGSHVGGHGRWVDSSLNRGQSLSFHGELSTEGSFLQKRVRGRGKSYSLSRRIRAKYTSQENFHQIQSTLISQNHQEIISVLSLKKVSQA